MPAAFDIDRQGRQSGEEKARPVPAPWRTVEFPQKFQKRSDFGGKRFTGHGSHALAALHNCNKSPIFSACGGQTRGWNMGFFTEMFARPRPQEQQRYRSALALLNAMSNADRADIGIKPADFPRIAREMSIR
ncbi:hypothetical protein P9254_01795 [Mesorhizobium sp. WSM4983]|nr:MULTISPECIES: hypothetical protein [unclassified Mesorhizobium]MDG4852143.1 hypothetical protein [Mesorhizobium sp. WSM4982]MDG4911145.1 hypothetical protein [Mesorhizobium sp. WSM4983]WIE89335.1 hypothetical protein P9270_017335 [Mesorhizobium sp. WSM4875]